MGFKKAMAKTTKVDEYEELNVALYIIIAKVTECSRKWCIAAGKG